MESIDKLISKLRVSELSLLYRTQSLPCFDTVFWSMDYVNGSANRTAVEAVSLWFLFVFAVDIQPNLSDLSTQFDEPITLTFGS